MTRAEADAKVDALVARYSLADGAGARLRALVRAVAEDPSAPTTVRDPSRVADDHLADSLVALELAEVRSAKEIADIGAGAGFPGLALAIALPGADVSLVESNARKCEFIAASARAASVTNASVVCARAEDWPAGYGRFDVVTARALAPLPVVAEYAAPLLRLGGTVVAWRGGREPEDEVSGSRAAAELGLEIGEIRSVQPYPAVTGRYLHLMSKVMDTPDRFPRRVGVARKRPLGMASDRSRR
jgi:16S rRNA (guanine527-N7)-methyltransferase